MRRWLLSMLMSQGTALSHQLLQISTWVASVLQTLLLVRLLVNSAGIVNQITAHTEKVALAMEFLRCPQFLIHIQHMLTESHMCTKLYTWHELNVSLSMSFDLQVKNATWALWTWYRNQDSEKVAGDQIYIVRQPDVCPVRSKVTKGWSDVR